MLIVHSIFFTFLFFYTAIISPPSIESHELLPNRSNFISSNLFWFYSSFTVQYSSFLLMFWDMISILFLLAVKECTTEIGCEGYVCNHILLFLLYFCFSFFEYFIFHIF
jgi:hypothetical protein